MNNAAWMMIHSHAVRTQFYQWMLKRTCLWASHLFLMTANLRESQVKEVSRLVWIALPIPSTTTRSHRHFTSSSTSEIGSRLKWFRCEKINETQIKNNLKQFRSTFVHNIAPLSSHILWPEIQAWWGLARFSHTEGSCFQVFMHNRAHKGHLLHHHNELFCSNII